MSLSCFSATSKVFACKLFYLLEAALVPASGERHGDKRIHGRLDHVLEAWGCGKAEHVQVPVAPGYLRLFVATANSSVDSGEAVRSHSHPHPGATNQNCAVSLTSQDFPRSY